LNDLCGLEIQSAAESALQQPAKVVDVVADHGRTHLSRNVWKLVLGFGDAGAGEIQIIKKFGCQREFDQRVLHDVLLELERELQPGFARVRLSAAPSREI
jgi:hypothetical protein